MFIFVSQSDTRNSASGNLLVAMPPNTQDGDLIVATFTYAGSAVFSPPTGWTIAQQIAGNTSNGQAAQAGVLIAYIVRGASIPERTFTRTGGSGALASATAYRNQNVSTPFVTSSSSTVGSSTTTPSFAVPNTGAAGRLIVGVIGHANTLATPVLSSLTSSNLPNYWDRTRGLNESSEADIISPISRTWSVLADEITEGRGYTAFHGISPSSSSDSVSANVSGDALHSAAFAVFASTYSDDRVYTTTAFLQALTGFIDEGVSVRQAHLHALTGFIDEGVAVRNAHLYAIIDPTLDDFRFIRQRYTVSNRLITPEGVLP